MHKLQRGAAPACLVRYQHGRDNWSAVSRDDKVEIWRELELMQGARCAYCEADIITSPRHIEHFRQRGRYPQGTFEWANLFGSCNRGESCGKHKDKCDYTPADLIKPDVDEPDDYFVFVSDGTIVPRADLSPAQQQRATETLRIFNIDAKNGALRHMRRSAATGYLQTADELRELAEHYPESDWLPLLHSELAATAHLPFATAIRHTLVG